VTHTSYLFFQKMYLKTYLKSQFLNKNVKVLSWDGYSGKCL
jgi:hypothetical protein